MKTINYSEGARIAEVSRQCINNMRRANIEGKRSWPFFCYDPKTGDPGIDCEHIKWKEYVNANNTKRVNKKKRLNNTEVKTISGSSINNAGHDNTSLVEIISSACVSAIKEILKPDRTTMEKLFKAIDRNLEGKL